MPWVLLCCAPAAAVATVAQLGHASRQRPCSGADRLPAPACCGIRATVLLRLQHKESHVNTRPVCTWMCLLVCRASFHIYSLLSGGVVPCVESTVVPCVESIALQWTHGRQCTLLPARCMRAACKTGCTQPEGNEKATVQLLLSNSPCLLHVLLSGGHRLFRYSRCKRAAGRNSLCTFARLH